MFLCSSLPCISNTLHFYTVHTYILTFILLFLDHSALTKRFRDLMTEFQVYLHVKVINNFCFSMLSNFCILFQTLRQKIQDEYREVVERRVITGLISTSLANDEKYKMKTLQCNSEFVLLLSFLYHWINFY